MHFRGKEPMHQALNVKWLSGEFGCSNLEVIYLFENCFT